MAKARRKSCPPYCRLRDEGVFFYREGTLNWIGENGRYTHYCVLLMPLSDDGKRVNMILGGQDFARVSDFGH